jgi:hypothetical protein
VQNENFKLQNIKFLKGLICLSAARQAFFILQFTFFNDL